MPGFKSTAQRERVRRLVEEGKVKQETFDEMASQTQEKIPERIGEQKVRVKRPRQNAKVIK